MSDEKIKEQSLQEIATKSGDYSYSTKTCAMHIYFANTEGDRAYGSYEIYTNILVHKIRDAINEDRRYFRIVTEAGVEWINLHQATVIKIF